MHTTYTMNSPLLVCDLDGTLIKEDLEKCFMMFLLRNRVVKLRALLLAPVLTPVNLLCKCLERGSLWKVWLIGLRREELNSCYDQFLTSWRGTIHSQALEYVRGFVGRRMLLTGSFEPLALRWLECANLRELFDEVVGCRVIKGSIRVGCHPYGRSKLKCLGAAKPAVALGNEFADRHVLRISGKAICVGADPRLTSALEKHPGREII